MTPHRTTMGVLALSATAALLTACSSGAPAAGPTAAAPARDTSAACTAQVSLDSTIPPGIDPDGPKPTAQEMQAFAAKVEPFFLTVQQNAPPELSAALASYSTQIAAAKAGKPIDVTSADSAAASTTMDAWVYSSCGFQTLDVVTTSGTIGPITPMLKPGPIAVKVTNAGDPAKAGFVTLLARRKDGQTATPADLDSGKADINEVADVASGIQPTGSAPAYGVAVLTTGTYLVSTVLGTPPNFAGSTSGTFAVSS